ncbi:MAG: hypothetical protein HND56_02060 [Pseudomonadota bacterium]|jgi:hypothetical protein|nr:hypothetical protein [Pseudomonadota bacterium]QKK04546.1 MAG: hypothetical protein HND56_02060 [Pseudomonadota bacterium]
MAEAEAAVQEKTSLGATFGAVDKKGRTQDFGLGKEIASERSSLRNAYQAEAQAKMVIEPVLQADGKVKHTNTTISLLDGQGREKIVTYAAARNRAMKVLNDADAKPGEKGDALIVMGIVDLDQRNEMGYTGDKLMAGLQQSRARQKFTSGGGRRPGQTR